MPRVHDVPSKPSSPLLMVNWPEAIDLSDVDELVEFSLVEFMVVVCFEVDVRDGFWLTDVD